MSGESAAGQSAWAESYAARALGLALAAQPEFWQHVAIVRQDRAQVGAFARRYVRRNIGRRRELLECYLLSAADAQPTPDHRYERLAIITIGLAAWFVTGDPSPDAPQRALRRDAAETIAVGAVRVARRGAGRCLAPDCSGGDGAKLRSGNDSYCSPCRLILDLPSKLAALAARAKRAEPSKAAELRREAEELAEPAKVQRAAQLCRPRWQEEAERSLFDAAIPMVLDEMPSRARARRVRRSGGAV